MSATLLLQTPPQGFAAWRLQPDSSITPDAVRRIVEDSDPVRRNLRITQSYHELTVAFDRIYGGPDVVWTAFATWASKQAGRYIRNEEVPAPLRRFLGLDPRRSSALDGTVSAGLLRNGRLLRFAREATKDVSQHIAEGNHRVYRRLAPLYARFLELVHHHHGPDAQRLGSFLAEIRRDSETTDELPRAFAQYYAAIFEKSPQRRAERMLLANLLVGLHEQTRLQGDIDGGLRAPMRRAARSLFLGRLLSPALRRLEDDWVQAATQCLVTLAVPEGTLEMGEDLPPLPDGSMYPPALRCLTLPALLEVLRELDRTPDSLRGSAARDWTSLADRMSYVADFFRSRQQDPRLLRATPFTPAQTREIREGRVPAGRL